MSAAVSRRRPGTDLPLADHAAGPARRAFVAILAKETGRRGHQEYMNRLPLCVMLLAAALASCTHVRPSQREHLASPAMQFEMDPVAVGQRDSVLEITEGGTFPTAGPGTAGAGCGCN